MVFEVDVTDKVMVSGNVKFIEDKLGPVDCVVNNAGFFSILLLLFLLTFFFSTFCVVSGKAVMGEFLETSLDDCEDVLRVNLFSHLYVCKSVLGGMVKRNKGIIVQVSSVMDELTINNLSSYCASKAAASSFAMCLRQELLAKSSFFVFVFCVFFLCMLILLL